MSAPLPQRYPDADVLSQRGHWDDATLEVVLDRVHNVPRYRYFHAQQQATLLALCERAIPQAHKPPEWRVPLAPWIDSRCFNKVVDGYRFDDMPATDAAWVWGLEGLDQTAQALHGADFAALTGDQQDAVLRAVRDGDPPGEVWRRMPARRWWTIVAMRQLSGAYYAHPYAWDEIGFGGPAYPRGYFALNDGAPEPWEAREAAPDDEGGAR